MRYSLKKIIAMTALAVVSGNLMAANQIITTGGTSGNVVVTGTVQNNTKFDLYDENLDVANIDTVLSAQNIGKIVISSRNPSGFSLALTSTNGGKLCYNSAVTTANSNTTNTGATCGTNLENAYKLNFTVATPAGTLGTGITAPTLTNLTLATTASNLNFSCSSLPCSVTNNRAYDLNIDIPAANANLIGGYYTDAISFAISDL